MDVVTIIYPVSVDPYSIQVRHPRVCKDEAHWLVVKLVIPGPMSFVLTYSVRSYLDTLGVHANWIDYSVLCHLCVVWSVSALAGQGEALPFSDAPLRGKTALLSIQLAWTPTVSM